MLRPDRGLQHVPMAILCRCRGYIYTCSVVSAIVAVVRVRCRLGKSEKQMRKSSAPHAQRPAPRARLERLERLVNKLKTATQARALAPWPRFPRVDPHIPGARPFRDVRPHSSVSARRVCFSCCCSLSVAAAHHRIKTGVMPHQCRGASRKLRCASAHACALQLRFISGR